MTAEDSANPYAARLARAAPALTGDARQKLGTWLALLATWNARVDLTAARSDDELVDLMIADAIVLAAHVAEGARVVDVGTGAGAPGLALAIARPDLAVTLVEPMVKRVSFLRTVLGTLGRTDVAVERCKVDALAATGRTWDVAMARATLPPPAWLAAGVDLVRPGGDVWVLLAKEPPPTDARAKVVDDVVYTWPLTGAARRAVRYVVT